MRKDIHAYYRALGLNPGAGPLEIRRAYRQLMRCWHPDLFKPGSPMQATAEDITKEINDAFEQLYRKKLYRKFRPGAVRSHGPGAHQNRAQGGEAGARGAGEKADPVKPSREERPQRGRGRPGFPSGAGSGKTRRRMQRAIGRLRRMAWIRAPVILGLAASAAPGVKKARELYPADPAQASSLPGARAPRDSPSPAPAGNRSPAGGDPKRRDAARASTAPGASPGRDGAPQASRLGSAGHIHAAAGRDMPFGAPVAARNLEGAGRLLDVFEVGDSKAKVLAIQGEPDESGDGVFRYGSSLVYFEKGRVFGWSDRLPRL